MKKHKFRYNPETLRFEKIEVSVMHVLKVIFTHLLSGVGLSILVLVCIYTFMDSPKEKKLQQDLALMESQYKFLVKRFDAMNVVLTDLRERDNNLYRILLETDTMPDVVKNDNILLNNKYDEFIDMNSYELVFDASTKADYIENMICQQSESYDELVDLIKNQEKRLSCIPAIQPILNKNLKQVASGFGWRRDPIFHTMRMHSGIDYSASKGTPIFATGDGKVVEAGMRQGYGNCVVIDHGFGYQTLYAHMQKIGVRKGQKVTRTQQIGTVGSTGKSTGSHLHYEVHYHGKPVNPVNYYFLDLTPKEYDQMLQTASNAGKMLD
ncbi:MAG: M23 family metallopeptidase [Paludibacteraceae bacterium]|nr:M23 family metallopeptidase [Paludibacteraceae bacterium]